MPKKRIVYWSEDDGGLYLPRHLDDAKPDGSNDVTGFERYEVVDPPLIKVSDLCLGSNDIMNALVTAGQARKL